MREIQENDPVLQGPGLVLQGPGLVLQGPGLVLQGPGLVLQGPGLVLQGPGLVLQGVNFNGPGLVLQGPGLVLQGMTLDGTFLSATVKKNGVTYHVSGLDFIGAELDLRLTAMVNGKKVVQDVTMRINDIKKSAQQSDVYLYDLTYRAKGSNQWLPYCGDSNVKATPLANYWDLESGDRVDDSNIVTFGCTNAVLAKCMLWGYVPFGEGTHCTGKGKKKKCVDMSLADHHQACTRMARADYCGDGTARTVEGTAIDIWDDLSPALQTPFTDWPVEAEWSPEGATCLNFTRHPEFGYPECFLKKGKPMKFAHCDGDFDDPDSLLATAFSSSQDDDDDDHGHHCKKH